MSCLDEDKALCTSISSQDTGVFGASSLHNIEADEDQRVSLPSEKIRPTHHKQDNPDKVRLMTEEFMDNDGKCRKICQKGKELMSSSPVVWRSMEICNAYDSEKLDFSPSYTLNLNPNLFLHIRSR